MKALLSLAFLALISFAAANITQDTPNFILGTWYSVSVTPADINGTACCLPIGTLTFWSDPYNLTKQSFLAASEWEGGSCKDMQIFSNFTMEVPFGSDRTYKQLDGKSVFNDMDIIFTATNGDFDGMWTNDTQKVQFDMTLDYTGHAGAKCTVRLSKGGMILKASVSILLTVLAFFAF